MRAVHKLILLTVFLSMSAQADLTTFCSNLLQVKADNSVGTFEIIGDILSSTYRPSKFGKPIVIKTNDVEGKVATEVQNIIFTLDSPLKVNNQAELKSEKSELKNLNREINKLYKVIKKALKKNNVNSCAQFLNKKEFSEAHLNELLARRNALFDAKIALEAKQIKKIIPKHFLKHNWEVNSTTHIDDIYSALMSKVPVNIILITHATESGQLVDSYGNILPRNLFKQLSSNVHTLSIYSCYSASVRSFYDLDNLNLAGLFMAKESEYMGEKGAAPLQSAKYFIRRIDDYVQAHPAKIQEVAAQKNCTLRVNGIKAFKSDFGLFLGTNFVGTLKEDQNELMVVVDCAQIIPGKSSFALRSMSMLTTSSYMELEAAQIELSSNEQVYSVKLNSVLNETGKISVIKAKVMP